MVEEAKHSPRTIEKKRLERAKEVQELALQFKPFDRKDDIRCENASYYGGFQLLDEEIASKVRGAITEIIKAAGKAVYSGEFSFSRISFPIKCMLDRSLLQTMAMQQSTMPIYLNYAASLSDPVERMKCVMVASLVYIYCEKLYQKPLQPGVGETYQAYGQDGAEIFYE